MFICEFCNRELKNAGGLKKHSISCHLNPNRVAGVCWNKNTKGLQVAWNKGLTKKDNPNLTGRASTPEKELIRRQAISRGLKGKTGGYRKGSGRGKSGRYRGYWCDSSYELAWIIYALDHNIEFRRNTEKFKYNFEGKILNYIPDFYIINKSKFIEIKGYMTNKDIEKIKQFTDGKLQVLCNNGIKKYINYAINKHGKNFIDLYE